MSLYDVEGNTVSTFYGKSGSSTTSLYDVYGSSLTGEDLASAATKVQTIYTASISGIPEGGCIGPDHTAVACFYNTGIFIVYDLSAGTVTQKSFTGNAYGHANGMTYNPNTERYYIAAMNNAGDVFVLDKTLDLVGTLTTRDHNGMAFNSWNIAYNRKTQQFISLAENYIYFYNNNMDLVKSIPYDGSDWALTRQDIETDGEYIYAVSSGPNNLYTFSMSGVYVKAVSTIVFGGEPESLMYDWTNGKYYMEGSGFSIIELAFKS